MSKRVVVIAALVVAVAAIALAVMAGEFCWLGPCMQSGPGI